MQLGSPLQLQDDPWQHAWCKSFISNNSRSDILRWGCHRKAYESNSRPQRTRQAEDSE
jgi:hypothetical protein